LSCRNPNKITDKVMDTLATVVFSAPRKTGKYMSIENGPSAVREPKIRIN
jgi:hypothetical protein